VIVPAMALLQRKRNTKSSNSPRPHRARGRGQLRHPPVAGRMPGQMNVLLAEANAPYQQMKDSRRSTPNSPAPTSSWSSGQRRHQPRRPQARNAVSGMPILNVDQAKSIIVIKRSLATLRRNRQRALHRSQNRNAVQRRESGSHRAPHWLKAYVH